MKQYTIYYVVGIKVGCTKSFTVRQIDLRKQFGPDIEIRVLETLPDYVGDQVAGDKEWEWADRLGYWRGAHYSTNSWNHSMTPEARERHRTNPWGSVTQSPEERTERARKRWKNWTPEMRSERNKIVSSSPRQPQKLQVECPHCGKVGQARTMKRWHFDNCRSVRAN